MEVNEAAGNPRIHQAQENSGHRKQLRTHPLFQRTEQKIQSRAAYAEDCNGCYYIKHNGKWYYLAGYLDLFNNEIVEWELSDTFDNFLVMRSAERLLKRKMSTEHQVLLHSDQGVQYSSAGYCNLLKKYNVIQSMSRAGTPHDNAVMESFWGRFKDTLRKHFRYWESDDLRSTIEQAIYYFNNERPVRKLKGKPPVLYRTELAA